MEELEFIKSIVKRAEEITKQPKIVNQKGGENDLVTNIDLAVEEFLINEIKQNYPDFDIVSEEFNSKKSITQNCFVIDPIDGTINFSNNLPLWGIQVACIKNGETVAAAISLPKLNEFYYADKNGAYLNGEKLSVKEVPIKNTLYSIDGTNNLPAMQRMRNYSSSRRNLGAVCVSMAFVSSGRLHGTSYRSDKPWDYVPGMFIAKMAGAKVCDESGFHAAAMNQEFLEILKLETSVKNKDSNIFVLHSLNGDTLQMWGKDVKEFFTEKEIDVYLPEFPIRAESSYVKFKDILSFYYENGTLNNNSIVVCHSIGNPYFIRFCKEFNFIPKAYIAVAPGAVYEYPSTRNDYIVEVKKNAYPKDDDLKFIKDKFSSKYCLYSDEDDNNTEKFTRFLSDTNCEGIYLKGYNHFDGYHKIYKIPELLNLLNELI